MQIIGRAKEQRLLKRCLDSKQPEFLAVYGRRRVGKTFLIREFFQGEFAFYLTGTANAGMNAQLDYFNKEVQMQAKGAGYPPAANWRDAFQILRELLQDSKLRHQGKRVVFFDEIAWLDTRKSGFLSALEHFWNSWGSAQPDLILIVCGSASSWIIKKLFKNRGGLHNRVTKRLRLEPFTLAECEHFFASRNCRYSRRMIADAYMVFGGTPYYLDLFEPSLSVAQNVDAICFGETAPLADEFDELYSSLFEHAQSHVEVVKALAAKRMGMTRDEIIRATGLPSGGSLSSLLEELEQSGFIRRYSDYRKASEGSIYQLLDFFSIYYLTFMGQGGRRDRDFWSKLNGKGAYNAWAGLSFELLCLTHIEQIKDGLGISGVSTSVYAWRDPEKGSNMQIDLVIDRADGIVDLCESKYTLKPYAIGKSAAESLNARRDAFIASIAGSKAVRTVVIAAAGLKENTYSYVAAKALSLDDLFRCRSD